jgi:hypothetical protein
LFGSPSKAHLLRFETSWAGDGAVPIRSAVMEGLKTWFFTAEHAALPNDDRVHAAVIDLLRTGPAAWVGVEPPAPTAAARLSRRFTASDLRAAPPTVPVAVLTMARTYRSARAVALAESRVLVRQPPGRLAESLSGFGAQYTTDRCRIGSIE